jgi:type VI protein secretion system component VasF
MLRPVADHDALKRIAEASDGRFHLAQEQTLLDYLDELRTQINAESRHTTTHWPDWKRLPASDRTRDQVAGIWSSFSLVTFLLFVSLLGSEWYLRRKWSMM